jgi:hypothetical protein
MTHKQSKSSECGLCGILRLAAGRDERLQVRWSEKRPDHALVAVPYRDGWFYIDERDQATKYYFRLLTGVWSAAIADSTLANPAPILTVPVGG